MMSLWPIQVARFQFVAMLANPNAIASIRKVTQALALPRGCARETKGGMNCAQHIFDKRFEDTNAPPRLQSAHPIWNYYYRL